MLETIGNAAWSFEAVSVVQWVFTPMKAVHSRRQGEDIQALA